MPGQLKYKTVYPPQGDGRRIKIATPKKGIIPRTKQPGMRPAHPSRPVPMRLNRRTKKYA